MNVQAYIIEPFNRLATSFADMEGVRSRDEPVQELPRARSFGPQPQSTEAHISLIHQSVTQMRRGFDRFDAWLSRMEAESQVPSDAPQHGAVTSEVRALSELVDARDRLEGERNSLQDTVARHERTITELDQKVREGRARSQKLQQIIISSGQPDNEPSDDRLASEVRELSQMIQKIANGSHFQTRVASEKYLSKKRDILKVQDGEFYNWSKLQPDVRKLRVRGIIFNHLKAGIFDPPQFGLEPGLEQSMAQFELSIKQANQVSLSDIVEWRKRTVLAARTLNVASSVPDRIANELFEFLLPVVAHKTSDADRHLLDSFKTLCENALKLVLVFRGSKTGYSINTIPLGTQLAGLNESEMTVVSSEGDVDPSRASVYTLFGALVKTRNGSLDGDGEDYVLEKAQVVSYMA